MRDGPGARDADPYDRKARTPGGESLTTPCVPPHTREISMLGLMQYEQLMISDFIVHAARHHARAEIVSHLAEGIHRQT